MSRWIDNFENHAFRATWEDLKSKLEESEADNTVPTAVQELARLKKVVAYLDTSLANIDPELFPTTLLDAFNKQATPCRDQINNFNSNLNIAHINAANNHVDNLLTYIRPYMIVEGSMKKTLLSSVRAYSTEMEKSLEKFNESATEELGAIQVSKSKIDTYEADSKYEFEATEEARGKIDEYVDTLFNSTEEDTSIKDTIEGIEESFTQKHEEMQLLYDEAFEDDEDKTSIKSALKTAKEELESDAEEAQKKLKHIKSEIKEFDEFYEEIFGEVNEETELREKGLKQELDSRLEQLTSFETTQNTKHTALFEKIEALLPGATSAGLASAYKEMKDSFDTPIDNWNKLFLGLIGIMFFVTFLSFIHISGGFTDFTFSFATSNGIEKTLESLLFKIPLYVPLVWLAIFSSKRRSEVQRLQQEYAHKETLAKSYDSYKTQIEQLEKGDQEMLLKLIEKSINTIAHNASETLDGKHGDGTPLQEFMKSAGEAKKIFGDGK